MQKETAYLGSMTLIFSHHPLLNPVPYTGLRSISNSYNVFQHGNPSKRRCFLLIQGSIFIVSKRLE